MMTDVVKIMAFNNNNAINFSNKKAQNQIHDGNN